MVGQKKTALFQIYKNKFGGFSPIFTGIQYLNYEGQYEGHQFFLTDHPGKSEIIYDGIAYKDIPVLYDIYYDEVIVVHNHTLYTKLNKSKVKLVIIQGHKFVKVLDSGLPKGFYELVLDGSIKVFARYEKKIKEEDKGEKRVRRFMLSKQFYLKRNDVISKVTNRHSLFNFFGDQRKKIKKEMKEENLNYRLHKQEAIVESVLFYVKLMREK